MKEAKGITVGVYLKNIDELSEKTKKIKDAADTLYQEVEELKVFELEVGAKKIRN